MDKRYPYGRQQYRRLGRPTTGESVEPAGSRGPPCGRGLLRDYRSYTLGLSFEVLNRVYRYLPRSGSPAIFFASTHMFFSFADTHSRILRHPQQPRGTDLLEQVDSQGNRRRSSPPIHAVTVIPLPIWRPLTFTDVTGERILG